MTALLGWALPSRRLSGLVDLSAVLGAGVLGAVAYGGLVGGVAPASVIVCLGGLLTVLAADGARQSPRRRRA